MSIEKLVGPALGKRVQSGAFDAQMGGLTATPSPSGVKQSWTSTAGFNFGHYENAAFDAQVDSATTASSKAAAKSHYRNAYQLIVGDAAVIWLYEPPKRLGVNARVQVTATHLDAWWLGLREWSLASDKRAPSSAVSSKAP